MLAFEEIDLKDRFTPEIYFPKNRPDWEKIQEYKKSPHVSIVDEIDSQIGDLIKANFPDRTFSKGELSVQIRDFLPDAEKEFFGNWVYFPWKMTLVHLLPKEEFIRVRTVRNNYKITPSEQQELAQKRIGIVGLSVGQSVALAISLERSCGELRLADFDTLELSNLNRIKAGVTDLGREKLVIVAREISEIDPYLKLKLYREGINVDNIDDFLYKDGKLDLLIDECDSFDIKLLLRERARKFQIPVMMDTSDRGMLDVERYDLEPTRKIFHGYLGEVDPESIKNLSNTQKVAFGLKITGLETLSPRMKASLLEVGQSISSWPQLASGVFLGGASVAHVGRRILLGEKVKSGRYYVDLDDLIPVELDSFDSQSVSLPISYSKYELPVDLVPSGYVPEIEELEEIVSAANQAPSGGNIQPWVWVFDKKGILHLIHDPQRSHSLLDFKGTGSLVAFGAALENLRLFCAKKGIEIEEIIHIRSFEDDLISSVRFVSKSKTSLKVSYAELAAGIGIRATNRKNSNRNLLSAHQLSTIKNFCCSASFDLKILSENQDLDALAKVIGGMDRMRLFHEQGLKDFIQELRWNDQEAKETRDGIDIATLELSGTEKAAMGLLKDPRTVRFFRKFLMGYGLTKISKNTITSASAMFLLGGKEYTPAIFIEGGKILQRIWIWANMNGLSFQPVTASLFIFHKVSKENNHGFSPHETEEIKDLKRSFDLIFENGRKTEEIFMFRINFAGEPSMRSYRRDVRETLKVLV